MLNDNDIKTTKEQTREEAYTRSGGIRCFGKIVRIIPAMFLAGSLVAAVVAFSASTAYAQTAAQTAVVDPGVDRGEVVEQLDTKHAETPVARGLGSNGAVYEVFAKDDGTTWTIIMTLPNGKSYMLGSGEYWANVPITKVKGPAI